MKQIRSNLQTIMILVDGDLKNRARGKELAFVGKQGK